MNKKIVAAGAISAVIVIVAGFSAYMVKNDKIAPNTIINGIEVGGLTKEEAKAKISVVNNEIITLKYENKSYPLSLDKIDFKYDLDKTVENAYNVNRDESMPENMLNMLKSKLGHEENVYIEVLYDSKKAESEIDILTKEINRDKVDAKLETSDDKVTLKNDINGVIVNIENTEKNMKKSLSKNKFESEIAVDEEQAEVTSDDLKGINSVLGTSVTTFKLKDANRSHNIRVATEASSKVMLEPGEEYSFNSIVGKRSAANGYKNAPVIEDGEMKQDLGGGVCQVSSTLYNAVLKSGLEIVHVKNHSIPSSYVGMGRDATVTDSGIDFVFKNPYKNNVYIQNYVSGDTLVCQVFGVEEDKQNIEISTSVISVSQAETKEVPKEDLPEGKKEVDKSARNGYTVVTYRIYKDEDGKQIKKEKIATSYYPKRNGLVYVGTKPKEEKPEENKPEDGESQNPSEGGDESSEGTTENKPV